MPVLRRMVAPNAMKELWRRTWEARDTEVAGAACPSCRSLMVNVAVGVDDDGGAVELDVCRACHLVWFDPNEQEQLPAAPAPPPSPSPDGGLTIEQRQLLAIETVRLMAESERDRIEREGPPSHLELPALFGLPVELNEPDLKGAPWATVSLAVVILAVSIAGFADRELFAMLQFVPNEAWHGGGITVLTSFFLHGGWPHLVGNLWFLIVFGDDVELRLGRVRWALLLLGATIVGGVMHGLFDPRGNMPVVGASGGISGLIVCYALLFPHARLGMYFGARQRFWTQRVAPIWVTFSAITGFVIWLLLQLAIALAQSSGGTSISGFAHLGGALVGVAFWLVVRNEHRDLRAEQPIS